MKNKKFKKLNFKNNPAYIENKDCPKCKSSKRKSISSQPKTGISRFKCAECKRTYQEFYTKTHLNHTRRPDKETFINTKTELLSEIIPSNIKTTIIKLHLQGESPIAIKNIVDQSTSTIHQVIELYINNLLLQAKKLSQGTLPVVDIDEVSNYYKKNPEEFGILITDKEIKLIHAPCATILIPLDQLQEFLNKGFKMASGGKKIPTVQIEEPIINDEIIVEPSVWETLLVQRLNLDPYLADHKKHFSSITSMIMKLRPGQFPSHNELRACAVALKKLGLKPNHNRQYAISFIEAK